MITAQIVLFALAIASTSRGAPVSHVESSTPTSTSTSSAMSSASASASAIILTVAEEVTSPNVLLRPTCPSGWGMFNISDTAMMDDVPLPLAWDGLGKFCEISWQGFDLFKSEGSCSKPGVIRSYGIGNFKISDRLVHLYETPSPKTHSHASPPPPSPPADGDVNASHSTPPLRRSWKEWLPFGWGNSAPPASASPALTPLAVSTNKTLNAGNMANSGHRGKPIESPPLASAPAGSDNPGPSAAAPKLAALEGINRHSGIVGHHYKPANNSGPTQYHAMVYSQIGESKMAGAKMRNMTTLLKLEKAMGGTKVTWDVVGCSDSGKAIEALLTEMHEGAVSNAANLIRVANKIQPKKGKTA